MARQSIPEPWKSTRITDLYIDSAIAIDVCRRKWYAAEEKCIERAMATLR